MIRAKKSLSQNFLIDQNICKKIIKQTNIKDNTLIEIGPGYGFMTDFILQKKPKKLILIEKDFNLINFFIEKYKEEEKVIVIKNDILKVDLNEYKNVIIISNLPYNISTKIILYLFNFRKNILEMIFMVQKEVGEKFDYKLPKMNKYKFLTKIVSSYSKCFDVSSNVFTPKPKVCSTVVKFIIKRDIFEFEKAILFSKLIFKNVRKKIYKNIKLKNNNDSLLNKRVNELSIDDLLKIYDFF
mgnify:CR=1 FL=1